MPRHVISHHRPLPPLPRDSVDSYIPSSLGESYRGPATKQCQFKEVLCSSLKIQFLFCFLSHDKLLYLATNQNDSNLIVTSYASKEEKAG